MQDEGWENRGDKGGKVGGIFSKCGLLLVLMSLLVTRKYRHQTEIPLLGPLFETLFSLSC